MNAEEIISFISNAEKKTPVKVYLRLNGMVDFGPECHAFGSGECRVVFGDWNVLQPLLTANAAKIDDMVVENDRRNSAVPLLDLKNINARIEPGALIRDQVEIGDGAVIMMGAVINIGAVIGEGTMIAVSYTHLIAFLSILIFFAMVHPSALLNKLQVSS